MANIKNNQNSNSENEKASDNKISCGTCLSRREMLIKSTAIPLGIIAGSGLIAAISGCGGGGGGGGAAATTGTFDFDLAQNTELNNTNGGSKILMAGSTPVAVVRFGNDIFAVNGLCSHQGNDLTPYTGDQNTGFFPCELTSPGSHGSQFSKTGVRLAGAASSNVASYTAVLIPDTVSPTGIRITIA